MTLDNAVRRVTWRIVPFLILCYFFAYLDRVNVSVAALEMNQDLGLTAAAFGLGAGLFFVGYFVFVFLTDRPSDATWLDRQAREQLAERLDLDARTSAARSRPGRWADLRDPRVVALTAAHLYGNLAIYGLAIFLPQIVRTIGVGNTAASSIAALPYLAGAAGMLVLGSRLLDRAPDPRIRACLPFAVSAVGFAGAAASTTSPTLLITALCVAAFGCFGYAPRFWSTPTAFLAGPALAVAIAVVNSFGNLGGFVGPYTVGALYDATGSFTAGLLACAAAVVVALGLMAFAAPDRRPVPETAGSRHDRELR